MNWSTDTNATLGYRVTWYSDSAGTTVINSTDVQHGGSYSEVETGLTASTQYWYKVSPIDPTGAIDNVGNPAIISTCSIHTATTTA